MEKMKETKVVVWLGYQSPLERKKCIQETINIITEREL